MVSAEAFGSASMRVPARMVWIKQNFSPHLWLAEGLDSGTRGALGNIQDLNEALYNAIDSSDPAVSVLTKVVSSPAVIAVPIVVGLAVAAALLHLGLRQRKGRLKVFVSFGGSTRV